MGGLTSIGPALDDVDPDVRWARAYLSRVSEPANIPVWAFVGEVGPVEAVAPIRTGIAPREVLDATAARRATNQLFTAA